MLNSLVCTISFNAHKNIYNVYIITPILLVSNGAQIDLHNQLLTSISRVFPALPQVKQHFTSEKGFSFIVSTLVFLEPLEIVFPFATRGD